MKQYVCGFLFSEDSARVVVIRKNRPEFQAGKINGVGGKVEPSDSTHEDAMSREFVEETGVVVPVDYWKLFCRLTDADATYSVSFFFAHSNQIDNAKTTTDEKVFILPVKDAMVELAAMPNIRWLIPMALSFDRGERANWFIVKEL